MEVLTLNDKRCLTAKSLEKVVSILKEGKAIVVPTDTSYGLAALIDNPKALEAVFELKGRPKRKSVSIAVSSCSEAKLYADLTPDQQKLWKEFMPGPLTIVSQSLKKSSHITRDDGTIALRCVPLPVIKQILRKVGVPITITSANRSALHDIYSFEEFEEQYHDRQKPAVFIDAGELPKMKPSTVVSIEDGKPIIHRLGPISKKQLLEALT